MSTINLNFITAEDAKNLGLQPTPAPAAPVYTQPVSLRQAVQDYLTANGIQQASTVEVSLEDTGETIVIRSDSHSRLDEVMSPERMGQVRFKTHQSAEAGRA